MAADGRCPHLGAAFATGGSVEGDELRCGMHGFCFNTEGRCTRTGYGGRAPVKARLGIWPAIERNGFVFVWYGEGGRAPAWDIPALDCDGLSSLSTKSYELRGHPQETTENSVDIGHLRILHGYRDVQMTSPLRTDGPYLTASFAFSRSAGVLGRREDMRAFYTVHVYGLGYSFVEVEVPRFNFRTQQFVLTRPTEAGAIDLTLGLRVRSFSSSISGAASDSLRSRLVHRGLDEILNLMIFQGFKADVGQDLPVWNCTPRSSPGPIAQRGSNALRQARKGYFAR